MFHHTLNIWGYTTLWNCFWLTVYIFNRNDCKGRMVVSNWRLHVTREILFELRSTRRSQTSAKAADPTKFFFYNCPCSSGKQIPLKIPWFVASKASRISHTSHHPKRFVRIWSRILWVILRTDRHTDRQIDRQTDRQTHGKVKILTTANICQCENINHWLR